MYLMNFCHFATFTLYSNQMNRISLNMNILLLISFYTKTVLFYQLQTVTAYETNGCKTKLRICFLSM